MHFSIKELFSSEKEVSFGTNVTFAFASQGVSLFVSVMMSVIVPKALGVSDYAYWQLFLLISSYVGIGLLGVNDGLYLRLGGKRYGELNYEELKAQNFRNRLHSDTFLCCAGS